MNIIEQSIIKVFSQIFSILLVPLLMILFTFEKTTFFWIIASLSIVTYLAFSYIFYKSALKELFQIRKTLQENKKEINFMEELILLLKNENIIDNNIVMKSKYKVVLEKICSKNNAEVLNELNMFKNDLSQQINIYENQNYDFMREFEMKIFRIFFR